MNRKLIKKIVHWLLFVILLAYVITGFGITEPGTVRMLTLGLLDGNLSFRIHNDLLIPFIILLALHVLLVNNWAERLLARLKS